MVVTAGERFKLRPSSVVRVPERYGTITYRTNRAGYRDRDHGPAGGSPRLVLLGDSVTFGLGVQHEQTFAALLQRQLAGRHATPWEVVNLAMFAYDTSHELAALREEGLAHRPRVVVLQFYMNDFAVPRSSGPAAAPGLRQRLLATKNRLAFRSALWRRLHQARTATTYALLHDLRRRRWPESLNADEPIGKLAYLQRTPDSQVLAFQLLREVARLSQRHGARFLLLVTPDEVQLYTRRYDEINRRIAEHCRRHGIQVADTLPVLRAAPDRERLFNDGVHLSPAGHQRVATYLGSELQRRGMLHDRVRAAARQPAPS